MARYDSGVIVSKTRWWAFAVSCALSVAGCDAPTTPDKRAAAISNRTMSPFCPGRTLTSCPSPSAAEWRQQIRQWVAEGVSTDEIRRRLEARAAVTDLSGTPDSPFGWGLPVGLGLTSLGVLGLVLFRLRRARRLRPGEEPSPDPTSPQDESSDLDARLDRELAVLDRQSAD